MNNNHYEKNNIKCQALTDLILEFFWSILFDCFSGTNPTLGFPFSSASLVSTKRSISGGVDWADSSTEPSSNFLGSKQELYESPFGKTHFVRRSLIKKQDKLSPPSTLLEESWFRTVLLRFSENGRGKQIEAGSAVAVAVEVHLGICCEWTSSLLDEDHWPSLYVSWSSAFVLRPGIAGFSTTQRDTHSQKDFTWRERIREGTGLCFIFGGRSERGKDFVLAASSMSDRLWWLGHILKCYPAGYKYSKIQLYK